MKHTLTHRTTRQFFLGRSAAASVLAIGCALSSAHCAYGDLDDKPDGQVRRSDGGTSDGPAALVRDGGVGRADGSTPTADASTPPVMDPPGATVSPAYLPDRRTYDHEREFIAWEGAVGYVDLAHRDGTALPGGESCGGGCTEQVTRISAGGAIRGNFNFLSGFRVQLAFEPASDGVGRAIVEACGQQIGVYDMRAAGTGLPGFNNFPAAGSWPVPTEGACAWSIRAVDGYIDVRAVTPTYRTSSALPTVDLRVNGTDAPLTVSEPGEYLLNWTSSNAVACNTTGAWAAGVMVTGGHAVHAQAHGQYTYTITCSNSLGSASD
ncbi:MAG: hypothetical protein WCJ30_22270, partial [Deltaproteobacteria bacterium]